MLPTKPLTVQRRGNVVRVVGPPPCYLVCDACTSTLLGPHADGKAWNPSGVRDALCERYGDGYAVSTSPGVLPAMPDDAAEYLGSRAARNGMDFGTWQKMRDLQR